ncbi:BatD family protein [Paracoccus aminophilus]|uniref:Oxygen tolerance n=1 Tax=Paracoccus aminophilus JCM 7686 TaxID=1367847 RepID=S5XYI9_PARAH|nr:BatD family protein [Paracoccus aminophilus]AGT10372.1 hypothetical protein JCM7686_3337 [Paracoccus aminophilus JCM 7686]
MVIRALLFLLAMALPGMMALPAAADSLRLIVPEGLRPVVGEMIPVTVRGEYTGRIALEKMIFPDSEAYDWIQVARDKWADEMIEGKPFRTFERHLAVFPRQAGTLAIGPVTHLLTKSETGQWQEEPVTAAGVSVPVMAYPGAGRPLVAREVEVKDEFSADPSKLGPEQSFTRRITVIAQGTMAHFLPPRPDLHEPWLISFAAPEIRETRLTAEGPVAVVVWEWTMRPKTGETGELTPIQIFFYNPLIRELRGAFTLPIEIGLGGTAGNLAGAARPSERFFWSAGGIGLAGLVLALVVLIPGQGFAGPRRAWARLRGALPNPHRQGLRRAAEGADLMALRQVARDYAAHERAFGRGVDEAALATLDRAIFAAPSSATSQESFDRGAFLRRLRARRPALGD